MDWRCRLVNRFCWLFLITVSDAAVERFCAITFRDKTHAGWDARVTEGAHMDLIGRDDPALQT